MKYLDTMTGDVLTESDIIERYENYVYWFEFDGEKIATDFEQWLNTRLELGEMEEL